MTTAVGGGVSQLKDPPFVDAEYGNKRGVVKGSGKIFRALCKNFAALITLYLY
jgi:hypothetical protein